MILIRNTSLIFCNTSGFGLWPHFKRLYLRSGGSVTQTNFFFLNPECVTFWESTGSISWNLVICLRSGLRGLSPTPLSPYFPDSVETSQTVWNISRLFGNFPVCVETFLSVWKLSMIAGNLPHFGNFPVGLGTFQTGWKLSKLAGIFQDWLEIFQLYWAVKALLSCAGLHWVVLGCTGLKQGT